MEGKDNESVLAWGAKVIAEQAKKTGEAIKADLSHGTGPAIAREAIKDVRSTMNSVFFGQAEGVGEPGAPLNPMPSEVAEERKVEGGSLYGKDSVHGGKDGVHGKPVDPKRLPSPAEVAKEKRLYQASDYGEVRTAAIEPETFTERVMRSRQQADQDGGNSSEGNERYRVRSLPAEQKAEQDKGRGR